MLSLFDDMFAYVMSALRQPLESFIRLETADDRVTLVADDGSLVSVVKIHGARQLIGDSEYNWIVEQSTLKLGSRFDRPGHALQVYFMRNPDRAGAELEKFLRPPRKAAEAIGLDLDDLFDERQKHLAKYLAHEDIYFVCWTRQALLPKAEMERSLKEKQEKKWAKAPNAQFPHAAIPALRMRHRSYVLAVASALEEIGIQCEIAEVHDALRAVRASIYPARNHDGWHAVLPGDKISPREKRTRDKSDTSDVLWPPLRHQIVQGDARQISDKIVQIGDLIYAPVDLTLAPMDPTPFPQLLSRLAEMDVPFRMSFLIEGGGIAGMTLKKTLSSILGFTNSDNKQIKKSLEMLDQMSKSEPVVRLRLSFCTWAPKDNQRLLEDRVGVLTQAIESWGYAQVTQLIGDPLEGVMSSVLAVACQSTAPPAVAPLHEVVKLIPWQRASSPFQKGSVMFRTVDGRLWPYQTGSTLTTTWFDLIFAQPGAGKSVLMNALNMGTVLSPGNVDLPFIAVVDIGPSSSGLISVLKEALPPDKRHMVAHYKLRMSPEFAINPFDTQLGARYPLPDERSFLIELLTMLSTPPGQTNPYDGIPQLAGFVVDEMFRWRDDHSNNAEPRSYLPRLVDIVDEAIKTYNIQLPKEPLWWDVVDALYDAGLVHEATMAQRQCSPVLSDAVTAARRPQIRTLLEETNIGASPEGVIHAFERMMSSAIREYPILAGISRFDIGDTRICALDLQDVSPQGDETADRQTALMYLLARHILVRHWWLGEDALKHFPERYKPYHEKRLKAIRETPKRLCYDEFHRTSKSKSVRQQVVRDVREGRKWGVQITLASQLLDDFDNDMVDLATGVWILGAAVSDRTVNVAVERFGLSDTARWVMRHRLTGPRRSGAPALLVLGTNEGRYEQFLMNTMGPIELWAYSTSAEDVALRRRLYDQLGAARGRQVLAASFPNGTARPEIQRRVAQRADAGEVASAATSAVIDEIASDLARMALQEPIKQALGGD